MADNPDNGSPAQGEVGAPATEHLNIKVTDNNNEVFFKIKRSTKLEKLMLAFCERQGKSPNSVRFLFEGQRVQPTDTPDTVRDPHPGSCEFCVNFAAGDPAVVPTNPCLSTLFFIFRCRGQNISDTNQAFI